MAERPRHPRLACLHLRSRRDGIPVPLVTHHCHAQPWGHPGAEVRRRHGLLIVLGLARRCKGFARDMSGPLLGDLHA
jgi:hypothetical protein